MKCEITTNWKGVDERMTLTREKEPDEVWTAPGGDARAVRQMIEVLDQTFTDMRAALITMLPREVAEGVPIVAMLTREQAGDFLSEGQR